MIQENSFSSHKRYWLWGGLVFLGIFWWFGYDGITFSDDVIYLKTGQDFWEGKPLDLTHHFSSRIGSFLFSGLFTYLFGFSDRMGSIASLISYVLILLGTYRLVSANYFPWVILFLCTHVFFMHFLTKVYPDSLLALWVFLIPFATSYRHRFPIVSAFVLIVALFMGFLTKETIIFLFPFPLILVWIDWKSKQLGRFHVSLLGFGLLFSIAYLGYFWLNYGNAFYRIQAVHEGHYISEYTFFDKEWTVLLWRISFGPLVTLIERSYWLWLVLAIPGIFRGLKGYERVTTEFAIASMCLLVGFWWMSTSLEYYNPIHLNPRHLIIFIPILAILIGLGFQSWLQSTNVRKMVIGLILLGALIAVTVGDYKQAAFLGAFAFVLVCSTFVTTKQLFLAFSLLLLIPVFLSVRYQERLKGYDQFMNTFNAVLDEKTDFVVVNNFVHFSKEVLLPYQQDKQLRLLAVEDLEAFKNASPERFTWLIYKYYLHAYPKEAPDLESFQRMIQELPYELVNESSNSFVEVLEFRRKNQ